MDKVTEQIRTYVAALESGELIAPHEFIQRVVWLRDRRGLSPAVAVQLWESGSAQLLREAEALSTDQLAHLNAAATR